MSTRISGLSEDDLARLLHARLDAVDVQVRPWASFRRDAQRQFRHRRLRVLAVTSSAAAVAAVAIALALVLPGQVRNSISSNRPSTNQGSATHGPVLRLGTISAGVARVTAQMAQKTGFLIFVAGRNLLGPIVSATDISGGNSNWDADRNNAVLALSAKGDALWSPAVNPGRSKVIFVEGPAAQVGENSGEGNLVIADITGASPRVATTGSTDTDPQWSPNGKQIAFLRSGNIWLMSANGTHQHPVGFSPPAHTLAWSPNGKELAIGSGQSPERIAIIDIARRRVRWFTPAGHIEQYDPAWSPDGKQLVYGQTGPNALFISNLNGKDARQITTCIPPRCTQDVEPVWSPNGTQIAFVQSVYGVQQIAVVPAAGGKVRLLTAGPYQHNLPNW